MNMNNESKTQVSNKGFIKSSSGFYESTSDKRPLEYIRSFNSKTGDTINLYKDNSSKGLPQMSQMSSIQKSKNFVESHSTNSNVVNQSLLNEMRNQQRTDKPSPQSIPVTFNSINSGNRGRENYVESNSFVSRSNTMNEEGLRTVDPVESVSRSFVIPEDEDQESHHEEKTVTIKRKITRRKKGSEKINTLRDSYIEKISSPLPGYASASDTDDEVEFAIPKSKKEISETIPLKKAATTARIPTIIEPSPLKEEIVVPHVRSPVQSSIPSASRRNQDQKPKALIEFPAMTDLDYRDTTSIQRVQPRQYQSNHMLSEDNSRETYINERQSVPVSTYSARKENMKSQQMLDERNTISRGAERNRGHRNEMTEEIETITLQPIGKGVQDLAAPPSATMSRPGSRAATPRAFDSGVGTMRNNYYREESKQIGNYNTMPAMPKFAKANSVRNVHQTSNYDFNDSYRRAASTQRAGNEQTQNSSFNRVANDQLLGGSSNRAGNEQTINTSWHTRTESYGGGNRLYQAPISPQSHQESMSSNVIVTSEDHRYNLQMVLNSEEQWYQPHYSRDDVINSLREKETGSFFIRNSSTFPGAYGLALKVALLPQNVVGTNDPQADLVRHFLIETVEDASGHGMRLKGFTNELVYPSLAHLVQAHCQNAIALPTRLILPQSSYVRQDRENGLASKSQYQYESHQRQQQMGSSKAQLLSQTHRSLSSPGVNFMAINHPNPLHQNFVINVMYLGKVEIDRLSGDAAIEHAVDKIMAKTSLKTSTVEVQLDSTKGITLNDKMQKLFYTRQFPAQHVLFAGFDPKHREFCSQLLQNSGINRGRIVGVVIKKQKMILRENAVHLFCEIDDSSNIGDIITFVNENYLRRVWS